MSGEVIKEFLVSLGYEQKGRDRFVKDIAASTKAVVALAAAIKAAALAVTAGVAKMSSSMEDLYYASQRTGATVAQINALTFAASQMGATADDARASIEGLAQRMRTNPGYGGLVQSLVGGRVNLQNTAEVMDRLAARFRQMASQGPGGYAVANQYAQALGITEPVMRSMIEGMDRFNADYRRRLAVFNVDSEAAARAGNGFMTMLRTTRSNFDLLMQRVLTALAPTLTQELDKFNKFLEDNAGRIEEVILAVARAILDASRWITDAALAIGRAFGTIIDWYRRLSPQNQEFVRTLGLIVVAWRALNLAFLTSPVGIILSLVAAIGLLIEDYMTWKRGGESLIDWSRWEGPINNALQAIEWLGEKISWLTESIGGWQTALALVMTYIAGSWALNIIRAFTSVGAAFGTRVLGPILRLRGLLPAAVFAAIMNPSETNAGEQEQLERIRQNPELAQQEMAGSGMNAPPRQESWMGRLRTWITGNERSTRDTRDHQGRMEELTQEGNNNLLEFLRELFGITPAAAASAPGAGGGGGGGSAVPAGALGPTGGVSAPSTNPERAARARQAYDYFVSQGMPAHVAAGLVANLHHESGMRQNAVGDGGLAYGIAQWHPDRQARFSAANGGRDIRTASFEEQLAFVMHELRNQEAGAYQRMLATANAGEAGAATSRFYERPGATPAARDMEALRRAQQGTWWYNQFQGQRSAATTPMAGANRGTLGALQFGTQPSPPTGVRLGAGLPGGGVNLQQQTTIVVQGSPNPEATGRAVAGEQGRVNADLARNTQGAVR